MLRNWTVAAEPERAALQSALAGMSVAADKLRALARQSRTMSRMTPDQLRARSLMSLAELYEKQAIEIECAAPELLPV